MKGDDTAPLPAVDRAGHRRVVAALDDPLDGGAAAAAGAREGFQTRAVTYRLVAR